MTTLFNQAVEQNSATGKTSDNDETLRLSPVAPQLDSARF